MRVYLKKKKKKPLSLIMYYVFRDIFHPSQTSELPVRSVTDTKELKIYLISPLGCYPITIKKTCIIFFLFQSISIFQFSVINNRCCFRTDFFSLVVLLIGGIFYKSKFQTVFFII